MIYCQVQVLTVMVLTKLTRLDSTFPHTYHNNLWSTLKQVYESLVCGRCVLLHRGTFPGEFLEFEKMLCVF